MTVRVYISVDMEGITGVAVGKHVTPGEKEYDRFRRLMLFWGCLIVGMATAEGVL